eukprot:700245-Hanusia_phi.AAC.1
MKKDTADRTRTRPGPGARRAGAVRSPGPGTVEARAATRRERYGPRDGDCDSDPKECEAYRTVP